MKTPKFLIAVAIVFAALSLSSKAKADVSVYFDYQDYSGSTWGPSIYGWGITLFDVNNYEDYYLTTDGATHMYDGSYHLGYVPEGDYTTTIEYYSYDNYATMSVNYAEYTNNDSIVDWDNLHDLDSYEYGGQLLATDTNHPTGVMHLDYETHLTVYRQY